MTAQPPVSARLRASIETAYSSDTGKSYDFNTVTKLNSLLVKVLKNTGQLVAGLMDHHIAVFFQLCLFCFQFFLKSRKLCVLQFGRFIIIRLLLRDLYLCVHIGDLFPKF